MPSPYASTAPFPWFGGKRKVTALVWKRLGPDVKQYIEPFCGSAAMLLAAPRAAPLEVVNDLNGFIANFWRAVKYQAAEVAKEADYPVSHIDLGARHVWLKQQRDRIGASLQDPEWPGDARVAGWWLWGQCSWIGSGWCEGPSSNAGRGVQALGQIPHGSNAGRGVQALGQIPHSGNADLWTSGGRTAHAWLGALAARLERVRLVHGDWSRCLNHHYGKERTAVFLDPPYKAFEKLYADNKPVADEVADWARQHPHLRVALCGHIGDYDLPGWDCVPWDRGRLTYGSGKTTAREAIWFSPRCPGL